MNQFYDVIIIGAGPGGAAAGTFFSKVNKKVLVIDKRKETDLTACGGVTAPDFYADFGFPVEKMKKHAVMLERFIDQNNGEIVSDTANSGTWYGMPRSETDRFFRDFAKNTGVEFVFEETVREIKKSDGLFEINGRCCKYVILACGALSPITVNGVRIPQGNGIFYGMSAEFEGKATDKPFYLTDHSYGDRLEYAWITTIGNGKYNVGLGLKDPLKLKEEFGKFVKNKLSSWIGEDFKMVSKPTGRFIGMGENVESPIPNLFLIGDTANSSSDTGEGIRQSVFDADQVFSYVTTLENSGKKITFQKPLDLYIDNVYSEYVSQGCEHTLQSKTYKIYDDTFIGYENKGIVCCEFPVMKGSSPDVSFEYYQNQFLYDNPLWNTPYKKTGERFFDLARLLNKQGIHNATFYTEMDTSVDSEGKASFFICVPRGIGRELLSKFHFGFPDDIISDAVDEICKKIDGVALDFTIMGYMESREKKCVRLTLMVKDDVTTSEIIDKVSKFIPLEYPEELRSAFDGIDSKFVVKRALDFDLFEDGTIGSTFGIEMRDARRRNPEERYKGQFLNSPEYFGLYDAAVKLSVADETVYRINSMNCKQLFTDETKEEAIDFSSSLFYYKFTFKNGKLSPLKAYFSEELQRKTL